MAFECRQCTECCQRYWITLLPGEAKAQAEHLGLSLEDFLERHCQLFLQVFFAGQGLQSLALSKAFVPRKVLAAVEGKGFAFPERFIALPQIAFKRSPSGACSLLGQDGLCIIHPVKPEQCNLFPFLDLKKDRSPFQLYPYCPGLKEFGQELDLSAREKAQLERVKQYFDAVKEKGFQAAWPFIPQTGVLCFRDKAVFRLSRADFLGLIAPFA